MAGGPFAVWSFRGARRTHAVPLCRGSGTLVARSDRKRGIGIPQTDKRGSAWNSSASFVGRPYPIQWGLEYRFPRPERRHRVSPASVSALPLCRDCAGRSLSVVSDVSASEHKLPIQQRSPLRGTDLANRRLQPLGHLSLLVAREVTAPGAVTESLCCSVEARGPAVIAPLRSRHNRRVRMLRHTCQ